MNDEQHDDDMTARGGPILWSAVMLVIWAVALFLWWALT